MTRAVLDGPITDDRLDDARLALGWQLVNVLPKTRTSPSQLHFLSRDRRSLVAVVDDPQLDLTYLAASSPTPELLRAELSAIRSTLPTLELAVIDALLGSSRAGPPAIESLARGLGAAALVADESPARSARFVAALQHESREIRVRALVASAYARWPSLRPAIGEVARTDVDLTVRSLAENALTAFAGLP